MSDSGYTPSMERITDMYSWSVAWDASTHDDRPDLAALQVRQRAEFNRALAAHDREVAAKAVRAAIIRIADEAESNALWTENNFLPGPNSEYAIRHEREMAEHLRERTAALGTPEQEEEQ